MRALPLAVLILGGIIAIGVAIAAELRRLRPRRSPGGAARGLSAGGSARSRSQARRRLRSRGQ